MLSVSVIIFEFIRIIFGLFSFHMMQPDDIKVDIRTDINIQIYRLLSGNRQLMVVNVRPINK